MNNLAWFLDNLDDAPDRIHQGFSTVWHDETGASALGAPDLDPKFSRWLLAGERSIRWETWERPCEHFMLNVDGAQPRACPDCSTIDPDSGELVETKIVRGRRQVYRYPMRAALYKVSKVAVKAEYPNLAVTLALLARARDIEMTIDVLATRYRLMGDRAEARRHLASALRYVRQRFAVQPPAVVPHDLGKSESQLNAEGTKVA